MTNFRVFLAHIAFYCSSWTSLYGQGYAPEEAVSRMTVGDGLKVALHAHEPDVRQAIFVKCDDRGRLWTIQYLQYPNPAGLKRVEVDRWSRTTYDRIPEPPPQGPRGADKITICEDLDGDGTADKFTDFVDGLNLVTGLAFGHGGVFVLNVPYLLFYPDRNRDDVPDSEPEVLLKGFGMEDAQSLANHLTWGPDGWLYGVNGSTTTCNVSGVEFQSGAWRYHPLTKKFELFCEGGYNCYGLTFDMNGELLYSTNGGPFIHAMQGAYYYKSFGKHGPLHNLYTYHHFPLLECDQVPGGPPTGGTIYLEKAFPQQYHGKFIAGNFLGHTVSWWNLEPKGSTFRAHYGGVLLDSRDTWFGPTDLCVGPDGSMYVSDFHDKRTAHPDPDAQWDDSNGRLFKIETDDPAPPKSVDISALTSSQLVDVLIEHKGWWATRARMELAHRRDSSMAGRLSAMATQQQDGQQALQGLWALHAIGCFDDKIARELVHHPYPYVRYWVTRLLGDTCQISSTMSQELTELAARETSAPVIGQLACSAKRLPPHQTLPIINELLDSEFALTDERIPWLIWWAIESKAASASEPLVQMFSAENVWGSESWRDNALRLIRRWSAEGRQSGYDACLALLDSSPAEYRHATHEKLRQGLSERGVGLHGIGQGGLFDQQAAADDAPPETIKGFEPLTEELKRHIEAIWRKDAHQITYLELAIRAKIDDAYRSLLELIRDPQTTDESLLELLRLLKEVGDDKAAGAVMVLLSQERSQDTSLAIIDVLDAHGKPDNFQLLLEKYLSFSPAIRSRVRDLFFSRSEMAKQFLARVENETIARDDIPISQLSQLAVHQDDEINDFVRRFWGKIGRGSNEETLATMRRYSNDLRAGTGDLESGKVLFQKHCAVCHQLYGEGNRVGPDLTTANRKDRGALLGNIVDPSAVVRREYESYVVQTDSGRTMTGLIAEQDAASMTLLDAQNRRVKIPRDEIEEVSVSEISLMPERLLQPLSPQELRDLFRYLEN